jgi:hypothetical protein
MPQHALLLSQTTSIQRFQGLMELSLDSKMPFSKSIYSEIRQLCQPNSMDADGTVETVNFMEELGNFKPRIMVHIIVVLIFFRALGQRKS